jgi:HEPN domain-containing protein
MNLDDAILWFYKADADFDSAKILNNAEKKHTEIICYLCAQAVEKYLKGYLIYNDNKIENTHNLPYLNKLCIDYNNHFDEIKMECSTLNKFNNNIRYPDGIETNENDVALSLRITEKIINLKPLSDLRQQMIKNQESLQ